MVVARSDIYGAGVSSAGLWLASVGASGRCPAATWGPAAARRRVHASERAAVVRTPEAGGGGPASAGVRSGGSARRGIQQPGGSPWQDGGRSRARRSTQQQPHSPRRSPRSLSPPASPPASPPHHAEELGDLELVDGGTRWRPRREPAATAVLPWTPAPAAGGVRFVLFEECSGSCKVFLEEVGTFRRFPDFNENGLVRCPLCSV
ncbi:unnamed protein product [Urochloa humidicola]